MRLMLAAAVALGLLVGQSAAVVAQAETEAEAPVVVSGTLECMDPAAEAAPDDGVANVHLWQASDPRLSGEAAYTGRWQLYDEPAEDSGIVGAGPEAAAYEIVTEGGHWACSEARAARTRSEPGSVESRHTLVFSGHEGYEGMTAYLLVDWSTTPFTFNGIILPGEAPPYAEPQG